jgi:PAS domain S-box-containing protein
MHAMARHMSDRKWSQDLYQTLLDCVSSSVLLIDQDLRVVMANNTFLEKAGSSGIEMVGRHLAELFPKDILDQAELQERISRLFREHKPAHGQQRFTHTASADPLTVYSFVIVPVNRGENVENVLLMSDDVSEQARLAEEDLQLRQRLSVMEKRLLQMHKLSALGLMAGGIAHEIRGPLAISSSAAQFLMEDDLEPDFRKQCAEKVHSGIQKASCIIESLLKFAHPENGNGFEQTDLSSILDQGLALISNQARVQRVELIANFAEEPLMARGMPGLLEQAFVNLFTNALAAMPGGGTLTVSAETRDNRIVISVTDTGRGIPQAEIGNIFDPCYTTSQPGGGTGLGLPICDAIVKQHSGSIEVHSVESKGTTFTLAFPLFLSEESRPDAAEP